MRRFLNASLLFVLATGSCGGGSGTVRTDASPGTDSSRAGTDSVGPAGAGGAGAAGTGGNLGGAVDAGDQAGSGGTTASSGVADAGGIGGAAGATDAGSFSVSDSAMAGDAPVVPVDAPADDRRPDTGEDGLTGDTGTPEPPTVKDPYFVTTEEADGMHAWYLPWADRSPGPTDMSGLNSGQDIVPLTIGADGHLYRKGARYRLFGVNHFGDCAPTHETADLVAARLAKFGFNGIRFQGCDGFYGWPYTPALIDYSPGNGDTLDPVRLDRFDYFIAALRRQGIYFEVPLVNSRRFLPGDSGDPANPLPVPPMAATDAWSSDDMQMNQILGFILDPVVAAQQRYARSLLGHVNPYTGLVLGKDPAVALVEIANEAGIINYWLWRRLDQMDSRILAELGRKWNAWLVAKYGTTTALQTAWGSTPTATELLGNTGLSTPLAPWAFYVTAPAVATATSEATGDGSHPDLRIDITTAGTELWHVQLNQGGLALTPGQACRFSFRAKASSARAFDFSVGKNADPWPVYTPWQTHSLTADWQDYAISFLAPGDLATGVDSRVNFSVGPGTGTVWLSSPSLTTGGPLLQTGEALEAGSVPLLPRLSTRLFSRAALLDYVRFLRDCEVSYFKRMADFLRKDLDVTAYLVGSQIITSPPTVQAAMDAVDNHSYWGDPQFPVKMWDPENWYIDNESIVHSPPGLMDKLASAHVTGKPFLATEATHAHPNEFAGEGPLLTAAYGSLQDLDVFFQHEWGYAGQYDASAMIDYFDVNHHPPKLASSALAARLFRSFDIAPAKKVFTVAMDPDTELQALLAKGVEWRLVDASTRGFPMAAAAISRVEMNVASGATDSTWPDVSQTTKFVSDTGELSWDTTAGVVTVSSAKTRAVVGFANGKTIGLGGPGVDCSLTSGPCVTFQPGTSLTGHSVLLLELTEGDSFATGAGRALLSATGDVRNTEMQWNASKTSLGTNWGHAPTRVEVISAKVTLPRAASEVAVFALDGRGQRMASVPVSGTGTASFTIGAGVTTLWYEVVLGSLVAKGEGNHILDSCSAYCASVTTSLPTCYAGTNDCLEDCARWTGDILGSRCDCTSELDALFACTKTQSQPVCGRLWQGVPPSDGCLPAYVQAFKCAGKVAPCAANLAEDLVDDFEDGDLQARSPLFTSWSGDSDSTTTVTPHPFVTSAHGANGSAQAIHLTSTVPQNGWACATLLAANWMGVDLSKYVGLAFSARGVGKMRVSVGTHDLDAVQNYDSYGKNFLLTPTWHRYVVRFDDPTFSQTGNGAPAVFASDQVSRIQFGSAVVGLLDFWIDDVVLLRAN